MALTFETMGNATIQFAVDGKPLLTTDPWLVGTAYFGSWALDHPLSPEQIRSVQVSEFIWISHGHPDHLHHDSLKLLPKGKSILIPDHYDRDIYEFLTGEGFKVEILKYRQWRRVHPQLELLCLDNENQDAMLIARFGDALVMNLNDSPMFGEFGFLRDLVRSHTGGKTYMLALCSIDADMLNFVDPTGRPTIEAPDAYKPGAVWAMARKAEQLGAGYFCCSSSQHVYVRADTVWANPYRIGWPDMQRHWSRPNIKLVPPFVTMDVTAGRWVENHPSQESDYSQVTDGTGEDDWNERLSEPEWEKVRGFFAKFPMLGRHIDFIEVSVGGEARRFPTRPGAAPPATGGSGVTYYVPRRSLLETATWGYFDDLLIGNFMKTCLHGEAKLYPNITPIIAKLGGNAKVFTTRQHWAFLWRYLRRNPVGFVQWRIEQWRHFTLIPLVREWSARLGVFDLLKRLYRGWILRDPVK